MLTHFKTLLHYHLECGTMCPFVLNHPIARSYVWYQSSAGSRVLDRKLETVLDQ